MIKSCSYKDINLPCAPEHGFVLVLFLKKKSTYALTIILIINQICRYMYIYSSHKNKLYSLKDFLCSNYTTHTNKHNSFKIWYMYIKCHKDHKCFLYYTCTCILCSCVHECFFITYKIELV